MHTYTPRKQRILNFRHEFFSETRLYTLAHLYGSGAYKYR